MQALFEKANPVIPSGRDRLRLKESDRHIQRNRDENTCQKRQHWPTSDTVAAHDDGSQAWLDRLTLLSFSTLLRPLLDLHLVSEIFSRCGHVGGESEGRERARRQIMLTALDVLVPIFSRFSAMERIENDRVGGLCGARRRDGWMDAVAMEHIAFFQLLWVYSTRDTHFVHTREERKRLIHCAMKRHSGENMP